jgi:hypothetical protein
MRVDDVARIDCEQRVSVRPGPRDDVAADRAARARTVVHDERLPEPFLQLLSYHSRQAVSAAARRERDDDTNRLGRIRASAAACERQQ